MRLRPARDGVHVGQEDASYDEARRILGPDKIVGVTCYASRHIAMEAAEKGADYVAFGGFFPSPTKQGRRFQNDPEILHWWSEMMTVPSCAIGGITPQNCGAAGGGRRRFPGRDLGRVEPPARSGRSGQGLRQGDRGRRLTAKVKNSSH